jgi:guanosine-3',5'-bis(diphosphate) 3'-pyrophosphohydrolase
VADVERAYEYARDAHEGQFRHSGHPFITHPLAVADTLAQMRMDHQTVMAALLHDVIEDTGVAKATLSRKFGRDVSAIVDGLSKLKTIFKSRAEAQAENFQKMAMAMANDIRVILVKLADRLHNMRTLAPLPPEKRREIARETLDFYAPIANRLGIHSMKVELEELSFRNLYPMRAGLIERAVRASRGSHRELVDMVRQSLEECIRRDEIDATVFGREKHLYSIYRKMRTQRKSFAEIMDVFGFRIIVDRVDTAYRVLGAVHNLYKPVAGRFKDYVAIPKANGYQSLHTTLFGPNGVPLEIQIRTAQMDAVANNGIAGHWLYKSDVDSGNHARARQWVRGLLDLQQRAGNSMEFIENLRIDLFPDEVYVFTPKGEILALPRGACAVDFAYAVHTDIGNTCVACRVDRQLAPLSTPLQSGQTVEIITASDVGPNPDWLGFVATGKARSSIRHRLKHQQQSECVALGRRLLNRALANANTSLKDVRARKMRSVLKAYGVKKLEQLLEEIGNGDRMAYVVARSFMADVSPDTDDALALQQQGPLEIRGSEGLVVTYSKCCHPLPGDAIVAHISSGKGLVVHIETCRNIAEVRRRAPGEILPVRWDEEVDGEFWAELRAEVLREKGVIAELASTITAVDAGIDKINVEERNARLSTVNIILSVRDRTHLARIMRRLRNIASVKGLSRVRR